jgi:isoquinoline 1-oxidoreductase beta subunit
MAAGKRLGADWRACDTEAGFVVRGDDRFRFGELAAEAAGYSPPDPLPLRTPGEGKLSGQSVPRLDLPSKVDGTARFAGDVRLPRMVYASVRHGPLGDTSLGEIDEKAARAVPGVVGIVCKPKWVAVLGETWWAADRGVDALAAKFKTRGTLPGAVHVAGALDRALASGGETLISVGDAASALAPTPTLAADYAVPLAAHAAIEPLVATARASGGRIEVWVPTQAQGLARRAVAQATGSAETDVIVYPMPIGGGFGRKVENDAAVEAALLAVETKRPVQLLWSRGEELQRARHRPPAKARLKARLAEGRIAAWSALVATPPAMGEVGERLTGLGGGGGAELGAVDGARPPYAIPAVAIAHAPAAIGIESGMWRSVAHSYTAFFGESFMDELARATNSDPLSFRMAHLTGNPRLARCLTRVTATGGWAGGDDSGQGLAIHSAFGSHIALFAEAGVEDDAIRVSRLVVSVDCGRVINPEIVRQQIEGGLIWGLAATLGDAISYTAGVVDQRSLAGLALPKLADTPEIMVDIVDSKEAPGGVAELAVPVVAPAIANAIASATGKRLRTLPLSLA